MKLPRPDDLEEVELSIDPTLQVIFIKPNEWNDSLAQAYAKGILIVELIEDAVGRNRLGLAFLNPDPIEDGEEGMTDKERKDAKKDVEKAKAEAKDRAAAATKEAAKEAKEAVKARPKAKTTEEE